MTSFLVWNMEFNLSLSCGLFSELPDERNHRLFLAAGLLIEAGLVDTKTGELCYKKDRILQALKEIKYDLETSPNPDA
ncbi:TPA: hypothetical protein HI023_004545 [Escherichia coli]|nr:hypothetical protein [Escherichia coli]